MTDKTITDQREFNLLDYEFLIVNFTAGDIELELRYDNNSGDGTIDFITVQPETRTTQVLSCTLDVQKKADAVKQETKIHVAAGESSDVKFTLDDQLLFIVRINGQDSSIWFLSYDLAGNELAPLLVRKPEGESAEAEPEARIAKPQTLSVGELIALDEAVNMDSIYGDLERVVDRIHSPGCQAIEAGENLIRLMVLIESAGEDSDVYIDKIIDYAYARTGHKAESLERFKRELFRAS